MVTANSLAFLDMKVLVQSFVREMAGTKALAPALHFSHRAWARGAVCFFLLFEWLNTLRRVRVRSRSYDC